MSRIISSIASTSAFGSGRFSSASNSADQDSSSRTYFSSESTISRLRLTPFALASLSIASRRESLRWIVVVTMSRNSYSARTVQGP